ncbi:AP2/ERF and B3 domain-containing transcription factor At1g50680-like [Actinidia eriantha]|uniref:AP2/ERF and B3 domain-containing transcription factor At1g50680-like n=1 Tax=Actinidia eriantha TaxID=165200 RepID=UPI00258B55A1|nr:AP2/ERF and B3 domain-containing transcription factor At1g50680-like [Actinidia eriantha]
MEGEASSMIEDVKTRVIAEDSVSSSPYQPLNAGMHPIKDNKAMPAKFKGVVPQPNGHWGAQIYANHQRIWLGTFKSEIEAAMVYDSASLKLRTGDNYRNFPWTNVTVHEPKFQSLHSTEAILNMIKDGSYLSKFADFIGSQKGEQDLGVNLIKGHGHGGFSCKLLFQKELTPSDVGKLNRLVIPKKYAVKYFPEVPESTEENIDDGKVDEVYLFFYDRIMRLWKFRYCYWKSSQSFVFTRGWNRFVKEKGLKENDIIAFYVCEGRERAKEGQPFCAIDVVYTGGSRNSRVDEGRSQNVDTQVDLHLRLGQNLSCRLVKKDDEEFENSKLFTGLKPTPNGKKSVRLFGVELN